MADECPHENISVNQVWKDGKCVSSEIICDDCGEKLK